MVHVKFLFNQFNLRFVQIWTNFKLCIWGVTGFVMCWFRPHLNLLTCVVLVCFIHCHVLHHIDLSCIILGWAYCSVLVLCVYRIACFFSLVLVPLRSWGFVRLPVVLLQGFFFVFFTEPFFFLAGSQARWSYPWIPLLPLPCLVVSMLSLHVALPIFYVSLSLLPWNL